MAISLRCTASSPPTAASHPGARWRRAAMTAAMGKVAKIMGDPFALGGVVGDGKRFEDSDRLLNKIEHYEDFDGWSAPFTYAFYDTRLIRRSNWLLSDLGEDPYGRKFNYTEHLIVPTEAAAKALASSNTSSKKEEEKLKSEGRLYGLGQGLDDATREKLFTDYYLNATSEDGKSIRARSRVKTDTTRPRVSPWR